MKRSHLHTSMANNFLLIGSGIAGLIQGLALGSFGVFQDSQVYYELYKIVGALGIYDGTLVFLAETSKLEPVIVLLFSIESILSGGLLSEYWFLILNIVILNLLVSSVMLALINNKYENALFMFFVGFTVMSGYLAFSKLLYVWRSVLAFAFFILFIKATGWKRLLWMVMACLTHVSFFIFILLFKLIEISSQFRKKYMFAAIGVSMLGSVFIVQNFPSIFDTFTSGGNASVFFLEGGEHAINAWIAILFSMIVLLLVHHEYINEKSLKALYLFCLITISASLISYNSYQFMNRIILPASLVIGFLPFLIKANTWSFKLARISVVFSVIPTIRLLYMLFSGDFSPG